MIYFDSSYLIKCYLPEPGHELVRHLAREQPFVSCCILGKVECRAAVHRHFREGRLNRVQADTVIGTDGEGRVSPRTFTNVHESVAMTGWVGVPMDSVFPPIIRVLRENSRGKKMSIVLHSSQISVVHARPSFPFQFSASDVNLGVA